ncbi:carbonic anhydrase [Niabella yanshanensis]|uniref:carbonic anhydrase n=1 Tax=Niabella yanshanensis TaxID=577386 RepID=A0ABZ0W3X0_9BACT|nr:carbonic anhydrase [Niabella yanshanensis]WQD37968.1 carbonic anhydrase [Niabella yanshanensis]
MKNTDFKQNITPKQALHLLKKGHERFKNNQSQIQSLFQKANAVSQNPSPFAAVLTCMDSRTTPELIFDQGIGNIFTLRLAGNVATQPILGSLEYTVAVAHIKLIVVMGHTCCAAVKAACNFTGMENLYSLLSDIQTCIPRELTEVIDRTGENQSFVDKVALLHVKQAARQLEERSSVIRQHVYTNAIKIVPAMYNISTGIATFYDD